MVPERREQAFLLLVTIFIAGLTIASVLASKIVMLGPFVAPAGVLAYSLTFAATDVIAELWGKRRANLVVMAGFAGIVVIAVLVQVAVYLPAAPFWQHQTAFETIMHSTMRIIIASIVAYLISQIHDVWAFHFWKNRTRGRYLWLRNNLSTIVSQTLDTVIFISIAFYGEQPLWPLIWGQLVVKFIIAVLDTPIVYALVYWIRKFD